AILTRWTAHLRAYKRLLLVRPNLVSIVHQDNARTPENKLIITGDTKTKARSRKMCDVIKNNLFWVSLVWYKLHYHFIEVLRTNNLY
ncbi:hypothetical protein B0H34DRAFT_651679, partial [Crassisporium funariophilum]